MSVLTGSEIENVVSPRGVFMETKRKGGRGDVPQDSVFRVVQELPRQALSR